LKFNHAFEIETDYGLIEFELECKAYPGEPMVMYYPDGSGYPGSPPEVEVLSLTVLEVWDGDHCDDALALAERGKLEEITQVCWDSIDYDNLLEIASEIDTAYD
jgi:hypothetical protein